MRIAKEFVGHDGDSEFYYAEYHLNNIRVCYRKSYSIYSNHFDKSFMEIGSPRLFVSFYFNSKGFVL